MAISRAVKESPLIQGEDEEIYYTIITTPWGGNPTDVAVVAKDAAGNDVTDAIISGEVYIKGDEITLPKISKLTKNEWYRIEVSFTSGSNRLEAYFILCGEE